MNRTEILEYAKKIATIDISKESMSISFYKMQEVSQLYDDLKSAEQSLAILRNELDK